MFADDTLLYISGNNIKNINDKLNKDLECLSEWLEGNKLKLNLMETKYMKFNSNENVPVLIDGKNVDRAS